MGQLPRELAEEAEENSLPRGLLVRGEVVNEDLHGEISPHEHAEQLALDFIGGMTDSFFIDSYKEIFLPHSTA